MTEAIHVMSKQSLEADARHWVNKARGLAIVDRESYFNANDLLQSVKAIRLQIQYWFAPHLEAAVETKRKAEAARKGLADEQSRLEAPLVAAEGALKRALLTWDDEQEAIRRKQELALQAEAQQQAEAATLAAAAALENEAMATGDAAQLQEARDILAQPIEAPVVSVAPLDPHVRGVTYRDNWKAHPDIDIKMLAAAVAAGHAPTAFLAPNLSAINAFARATQGAQPVDGVKWFNDRIVAVRPF